MLRLILANYYLIRNFYFIKMKNKLKDKKIHLSCNVLECVILLSYREFFIVRTLLKIDVLILADLFDKNEKKITLLF